jgi:hypothetical protein
MSVKPKEAVRDLATIRQQGLTKVAWLQTDYHRARGDTDLVPPLIINM